MKKIISCALVCAMLLSVICLTGCNKATTADPTYTEHTSSKGDVTSTTPVATVPDENINEDEQRCFAVDQEVDGFIANHETFVVFRFATRQESDIYSLKNSDSSVVIECDIDCDFTYLAIAHPDIIPGEYTLWCGDNQYVGTEVDDESKQNDKSDIATKDLNDKFEDAKSKTESRNKDNADTSDMPAPPVDQPSEPNVDQPADELNDPNDVQDSIADALGEVKDAIDSLGCLIEYSEIFNLKDGANYFTNLHIYGELALPVPDPDNGEPEVTPPSVEPGGGFINGGLPNDGDLIPGPGTNTGGSVDQGNSDVEIPTKTASTSGVLAGIIDKIQSGFVNMEKFVTNVFYANWSNNSKIAEMALNSKALRDGSQHLPIYRFDTVSDFKKFKNAFSTELSLTQLNTYAQEKGDDFFDENSLILVYVTANSGSARYDVSNITYTNGLFEIGIRQTNKFDVGTCDMSGWFVVIEVPDIVVDNCNEFEAKFVSSDLAPKLGIKKPT